MDGNVDSIIKLTTMTINIENKSHGLRQYLKVWLCLHK